MTYTQFLKKFPLQNFLRKRPKEDSLSSSCSHTGSVGTPCTLKCGAARGQKDEETLPPGSCRGLSGRD